MSARPSDSWKTAEEHAEDSCYAAKFWPSIAFIQLEIFAAGLRSPTVRCRANRDRYAVGGNAIVIELQFEDSEIWVARLRLPVAVTGLAASPEVIARQTESEVATMKYVRERTTIPVPVVFAYSTSCDNAVGAPFIVMSAAQGCRPVFFSYPTSRLLLDNDLPEEFKPVVDRYVSCLVDYYFQLSTLRFERIGSLYFDPKDSSKYIVGCLASSGLGPFDSAWDYYTAHAELVEHSVLNIVGDPPEAREGRALVLWLYRLGLASLSSGLDDRGPFLLAHTDLHSDNTLVDKDGSITAVIDWEAGFVPVEDFSTQMIDWTADLSIERCGEIHLHRTFSSALGNATSHDDRLPSGRSLRDIHSSSTAYLVGPLAGLMRGPDMCDAAFYADRLSRLVLGLKDSSSLKQSVVFREWFELALRRANA